MRRTVSALVLALAGGFAALSQAAAQGLTTAQDAPAGRPEAIIDLATNEGARLVKGQWRYSDVKIVEVDSKGVGPDLKPSGPPIKTYDYTPHAGVADFDDSKWEVIEPNALDVRRATGRVCFNWYRIKVHDPGEGRLLRSHGVDRGLRGGHRRLRRGLGRRPATPRPRPARCADGQGLQLAKPCHPDAQRQTRAAVPNRRLRHERPHLREPGELHLDQVPAAFF